VYVTKISGKVNYRRFRQETITLLKSLIPTVTRLKNIL